MKLYRKLIALFATIIALCTVANAIDIVVNVRGQGLIIGTPANISLGNFSSSKEIDFTDYLWIEDLRASESGHYTSIQGIVYGGDGNVIPDATVEFRTNSDNIILVGGVADNAAFNKNMKNYTDITDPKLLFYRNNNSGLLGYYNKYGFKPSIKVTVPSGSVGPYTVRLSYTLYDMPTVITTQ